MAATSERRTLADLWPSLSCDERLSIFLEQSSAEVHRLAEVMESMDPVARGRVAGYANAVADVMYYVVEGNPLPDAEAAA